MRDTRTRGAPSLKTRLHLLAAVALWSGSGVLIPLSACVVRLRLVKHLQLPCSHLAPATWCAVGGVLMHSHHDHDGLRAALHCVMTAQAEAKTSKDRRACALASRLVSP
jgi:hypothetical protein